ATLSLQTFRLWFSIKFRTRTPVTATNGIRLTGTLQARILASRLCFTPIAKNSGGFSQASSVHLRRLNAMPGGRDKFTPAHNMPPCWSMLDITHRKHSSHFHQQAMGLQRSQLSMFKALHQFRRKPRSYISAVTTGRCERPRATGPEPEIHLTPQ